MQDVWTLNGRSWTIDFQPSACGTFNCMSVSWSIVGIRILHTRYSLTRANLNITHTYVHFINCLCLRSSWRQVTPNQADFQLQEPISWKISLFKSILKSGKKQNNCYHNTFLDLKFFEKISLMSAVWSSSFKGFILCLWTQNILTCDICAETSSA